MSNTTTATTAAFPFFVIHQNSETGEEIRRPHLSLPMARSIARYIASYGTPVRVETAAGEVVATF